MEVLVRPTGFEPAAYRVGVIRPSKKKTRFHAGFRYIPQIKHPNTKTVETLGTPGFPRFFLFLKNSSQTVVRGRTERENHAAMKGSFYSNKSLFWTLGFIRDRHTQFSLSHQWLY